MILSRVPYSLFRPLLFKLAPETSHYVTLEALSRLNRLGLIKPFVPNYSEDIGTTCTGLRFKNPLGVAGGLDKNADYLEALGNLGFGFVEVGTVTPQPQLGNPAPRLFRLTENEALINRMGFNNLGVDYLVRNLQRHNYSGVVGVNIGKNKETPNDKAVDDYLYCMRRVYPYADYISVNISSPNTPGLRALQSSEALRDLLGPIKSEQQVLEARYGKKVPIWLKISPDLEGQDLEGLVTVVAEYEVDALIATNTTLGRDGVEGPLGQEPGGLSGALVSKQSTQVIKNLRTLVGPTLPIVGVGGIRDVSTAFEKFSAGANLIQVYSGLIYEGWNLIYDILDSISDAEFSDYLEGSG